MNKKTILLVEDDAWLSEMYVSAFSKKFSVVCVASASEALDALEHATPDLLLLDMFLPDHNGVELLHEICSYDDTTQIPVVILSTVHERDFALQPDRWSHYGIVGYLYKPQVKPKEVTEFVSDYFFSAAVEAK